MATNKENEHKPNYCIKLLAGNNVVLVEADNYESEIFVPQIMNGRITFLNIIPNRRCCQFGGKATKSTPNLTNDKRSKQPPVVEIGSVGQMGRLSGGQGIKLPIPLANSTPAGVKGCLKQRVEFNMASTNNPYNSVSNCSLPTPEPVRKAAAAAKDIFGHNSNNIMQLPRGIKVLPLYHDSSNGTPKKWGRLVATTSRAAQDLTNLSILNGSFMPPSTPSMPRSARSKSSLTPSKPNSVRSKSTATQISNHTLQTSYAPITKWRKVITPMRTYTRRSDKPIMLRRNTPVSSAKKSFKSRKIVPTYLVNPTQAPKVTHKIEIMKRKLIVDGKVTISPRSFKKQQQTPMTPAPNLPHRKSLGTKLNLKTSASYTSSLPKSRKQMESSQMSAFDLLTNSNRYRSMTYNLNKQFRNGCVNKASSTYNKYKILCNVPPLQEDEQILELSRHSLPKKNVAFQQPENHGKIHNTKSMFTQNRTS